MEILGKRLKWLRNKERYSQKDIADMIGMTPSGYQKIELDQREPKLDVLVKLCNIFEVSADFLLGRSNMTQKLLDLSMNIDFCKIQLERLQEEHEELMVKRYDLQDEIEHLKMELKELQHLIAINELDSSSVSKALMTEGSLRVKENMLFSITSHKVEIEAEIHALNKQRSKFLNEYITELLELPDSLPSQDSIIMGYLPISIDIQPDIFDRFSLHLYGRSVGSIGHYGDYATIEETQEQREKLLKLLNGEGISRDSNVRIRL
ncbi:helix-turn-helix domain-containing protein [Bacillus sp. T33-2]|uniref:helix-turn-helix domain-containing protein n=1 Tax=Bacillus sp. T33-2 TaxID=2054168 RepID=UPI000C7665DA|nr:helix-turn-helix transcriptional regulator [Bacillus sp. T33-2]PLR99572.1 hypothetical protein CVD19_00480 [Bacillus sp. T33-2]